MGNIIYLCSLVPLTMRISITNMYTSAHFYRYVIDCVGYKYLLYIIKKVFLRQRNHPLKMEVFKFIGSSNCWHVSQLMFCILFGKDRHVLLIIKDKWTHNVLIYIFCNNMCTTRVIFLLKHRDKF